MSPREQSAMLLRKAAADEALVDKVLEDPVIPDELVGYHSQQAVEKLLKARLVELGVNYPKTHNLQTLIELLEDRGKSLPPELSDLDLLTPYATIYRYEDPSSAVNFDRKAAREFIRRLRHWVEAELKQS
ncbi:MAG: HEPN domain-containing protein [Verrucomicrobia bacterium]|nr:HEPN domain-containing protein [Verrucomicrobiota bacterium]